MEKWMIQHEFDTEPTYIVDRENGEKVIAVLPVTIPWEERLKLANLIVKAPMLLEALELALRTLKVFDGSVELETYEEAVKTIEDVVASAKEKI